MILAVSKKTRVITDVHVEVTDFKQLFIIAYYTDF